MHKFLISAAALSFLTGYLIAADAPALRKAPEFAFSIPGQGQKQLSNYRGKVVALEFIFTTCPHCQAASKLMTKLQQEYGSRGLQVIDVAINPNADLLVENFAKDFQVNFPVGWATAQQMQAFMGFSDARYVVPQLVLIDRKGYIHYQTPPLSGDDWVKLMTEPAIRQHIEELLGSNNSAFRHQDALDVPARY
ncbi:MAG TPA: TlpA disulfide reductase family protein [Bryobacteraceae bacterium]|nr:TlpA disulfide reductase family protein [Bryobacteraceae bacterium]